MPSEGRQPLLGPCKLWLPGRARGTLAVHTPVHFTPLITGQPVCSEASSSVLSGLSEKNTMASPFLGLAAATRGQPGAMCALLHGQGRRAQARASRRAGPLVPTLHRRQQRDARAAFGAPQLTHSTGVTRRCHLPAGHPLPNPRSGSPPPPPWPAVHYASRPSLATWPSAQELKGSNRFCTLGSIHCEACRRRGAQSRCARACVRECVRTSVCVFASLPPQEDDGTLGTRSCPARPDRQLTGRAALPSAAQAAMLG